MSNESWQKWAQSLQHSHLKGIALTLLEGAGPMKMIASQLMLATTPFFGGNNRETWRAVAEILEDDQASREFARTLREERTK